jgi:hypothetical protein
MAPFRSDPARRLRAEQLRAHGRAEQLAHELAETRGRIAELSLHVTHMPAADRRLLVELHGRARTLLDQMIQERYRAADLRSQIDVRA